MSKIQEVDINGTTYRIRAPRLREHRESKKHPPEDLMLVFLAGMLLDEDGKEFGLERVYDIPLPDFDKLAVIVNEMSTGGSENAPLDQKTDSPSGSPSPSEGQSVN